MSSAKVVLDIARGELGTAESPPGTNRVKYNTWYYSREVSGAAYPWCMVFVQWCMAQAGVTVPVRTASCGALMRAAKKAGQWVTGDYRAGDVLIYDFPGGAATDHTGVCEAFDGICVTAIEGNTGVSSAADGGQVRRTCRKAGLVRGAWRPDYNKEEVKEEDNMTYYRTMEDVPDWYRPTIQKLVDEAALHGVDDEGTLNVSDDLCRIMTVLDRMGVLG